MKKLIVFMLLVLVFAACKTVRNTNKTDTRTDVEVKKDVVQTTNLTAANLTTTNVTDLSTTTEQVEELQVVTLLSVPDSVTGKQFPIQVTTTKRVINKGNNKNVSSDIRAKSEVINNTQTVDKSDYKSDTRKRTEDKKITEVKTPAWLSLGVFVLIAALFALSYLVLKRYGIIK